MSKQCKLWSEQAGIKMQAGVKNEMESGAKTEVKPGAGELIELNKCFYQEVAEHFSQTRRGGWAGWERLIMPGEGETVLDVAGGNGRFGTFLAERGFVGEYTLMDACEPLMSGVEHKSMVVDILGAKLQGRDWREGLAGQQFDYIFCCAFLHHVPEPKWREEILAEMWEMVKPGGKLTVTLWQFMVDANIGKLIKADYGGGDYLLSWKKGLESARYCHNFSEDEIEELKKKMLIHGANLLDEYAADGSSHKMNRYLIWQKEAGEVN